MTVPTIKSQSSSYLQKIINSDFDMGSINADGLKVNKLPNIENDKGVPKTENPKTVLKTGNDKGAPIMRNGKGITAMKPVPNLRSTANDKSVPNAISVSDAAENETIASVSSDEIFRDVKSIDSDDSTPTVVPKSPSFGRPYHIKTNGSLNSSSCPSDAETDVTRSLNDDIRGKSEQVKTKTLPKQNNVPKLQRRHSEMEGINKESYMIGNEFKVLSGTTSLERNIHLHHNNESGPAADEKRLSGWNTIGHSFQRKLGEFDRTKRTTWGGKYASKQRESLKVLNELDNAYNYSSDSSVDHYYEANDRQRSRSLKQEPGHRGGMGPGVEDGGPDDVFISQTETEEDAQWYEESLQEYMSISMSGIYGIFLAVVGLVIPIAQTFIDPSLPFVFEAFFIYLYVTGILFIIYVYVFMMRKRQLRMTDIAKALSRRLSSSKTFPTSVSEQTKDGKPPIHQSMNHPNSTGSFYLRLGALLFGVGSMVDSGLHFGQHLQAFDGQSMCNKPIEAAKPFGHLVFTFVQLYFIFLNSKLCIHNNRTIARFGMIHLCCTNICVWIQSLVMETLSVLHHWDVVHQTVAMPLNSSNAPSTEIYNHEPKSSAIPNITAHESTPEVKCYWDDMMARVVQATGPYLYSCTIEYSIICTGILYVMWTNVGTNQRPKHQATGTGDEVNTQNDDDVTSLDLKRHKISVDCTNSSRGLFIGILVSVCAIIAMVAFYVMINLKTFQETAVVLMLLSEMTMYILTSIASFLAAERMHKLRHYSALKFGLEESLLLVSFTGLVMFGVFNIVPDVHYTDKALGVLNVMTNVLMVVQASIQTVLLLTTRKFRALNKEQAKGKYGRQFVTFLILCNFAMWTLETFQAREPEHNPIQVDMYGIKAWALFSHIAVPLGIFFRFHSFVYLLSIWKSAWKIKTDTEQK